MQPQDGGRGDLNFEKRLTWTIGWQTRACEMAEGGFLISGC